jgi:hypothetical protein
MRIVGRTLALFLPLALLSACGSPSYQAVTYTGYYLTCCTEADIDHVWQPDTTVELHWIVGSATRTTVNPSHKALASAVLIGPYPDVANLKLATGATHAVQGSVVPIDDRTRPSPAPVTIFLLPADLPPGYYQLNTKWDFGDGSSAGGSSIVRVARQP